MFFSTGGNRAASPCGGGFQAAQRPVEKSVKRCDMQPASGCLAQPLEERSPGTAAWAARMLKVEKELYVDYFLNRKSWMDG